MSSEERAPLLEVEGLHKVYAGGPLEGGGELAVLRGVDFTLYAGDMCSIVGQSGAGKSTLLHILGALDTPTRGTVRFEGKDLFAKSERELAAFRNECVGFVFQFHYLMPDFTALENVSMPAAVRGENGGSARKRATELLEAVGLGNRMAHRPSELSGGEQQRVAVARALMMRPRLLLADEPTGNLDGRTGRAIEDMMIDLNQRFGVTFVVVTHDHELAARMPRRLRMVDGVVHTLTAESSTA